MFLIKTIRLTGYKQQETIDKGISKLQQNKKKTISCKQIV